MEGRVIKLEGNPVDPISQGAICARGQAALQGLYNPDRLGEPKTRRADGTLVLSSCRSLPADLPLVPDRIEPGLPVDLLRNRPDIRQAERELADEG